MPMHTCDEMEAGMGRAIKRYRLLRNEEQWSVAQRAGVSLRALGNLENGKGSTLRTLLCVLVALGREAWLMDMLVSGHAAREGEATRRGGPRQRARRSLGA